MAHTRMNRVSARCERGRCSDDCVAKVAKVISRSIADDRRRSRECV